MFRHLDHPVGTPVGELGSAAIDTILDRGDFDAWRDLAALIRREPFGPLAETVLRLCEAHEMYGTSTLWRSWIGELRAGTPSEGSLSGLRRARGVSQQSLGERMGMQQSDVSKLERRRDVRVGTLRAYVRALGGELALVARFPEGTHEITGFE